MTLPKLVSLLETRRLHFTQISQFRDPFEGSLTKQASESVEKHLLAQVTGRPEVKLPRWTWGRFSSYVNCWCMDSNESCALWNIYGGVSEGLAIRSQLDKLETLVPAKCEVHKVKYVNYDADQVVSLDRFHPALVKRPEYSYEREVRVLYDIHAELYDHEDFFDWMCINKGLPKFREFEIDVDRLIADIVVSPFAAPWYKDVVESVIAKYGLKKRVVQSAMTREPRMPPFTKDGILLSEDICGAIDDNLGSVVP